MAGQVVHAAFQPLEDQVVDFFQGLFRQVFSDPFQAGIQERLRRNAVVRQIEEAADAASQSLIRLFSSQELSPNDVSVFVVGFQETLAHLQLSEVSNPNLNPESLVEQLLKARPLPKDLKKREKHAAYRVGIHQTVQVLFLVGPVMTEWRRLRFSSTFELPRRVVNGLNQINQILGEGSADSTSAADERFELSYRDYLLQRFNRVEAGTVKMTTNLDVDLRDLFVMPRVRQREKSDDGDSGPRTKDEKLLALATARSRLNSSRRGAGNRPGKDSSSVRAALKQILTTKRTLLVGLPGSGKSTFLEWLQLQLAAGTTELVLAGRQALPLLLRVRQLDPSSLPIGAGLIEKATASKDRATLMPSRWLDRQMRAGSVVFMLDGLDETEPEQRDSQILPWLKRLCQSYPLCRFIVSSRPVGLPKGGLRALKFAECELLDFGPDDVAMYTQHWCTAIRLARNEPEDEARREGILDGDRILESFKSHSHIENLARNPLMLSAICLVNYFEGGQLPKDRAVLYRLCVEGLLHHWDHRRGIQSEFALEEKLRACREVAISMQSEDRAEILAHDVEAIFRKVLGNSERGSRLLSHIRYRTGLLLERRPGVYGFAHLTFQEYLAAKAVHEGNLLNINSKQLARDHGNGRWNEVIALFCGLTIGKEARSMVVDLVQQPDSDDLGGVVAEAFLSSSVEVSTDVKLQDRVVERIARLGRESPGRITLARFPVDVVEPIALSVVGRLGPVQTLSSAYQWLALNHEKINSRTLAEKVKRWRRLSPMRLCELVHLICGRGDENSLESVNDKDLLGSNGPDFPDRSSYATQAEVALAGLSFRSNSTIGSATVDKLWHSVLTVLLESGESFGNYIDLREGLFSDRSARRPRLPLARALWPEFSRLARGLVPLVEVREAGEVLERWATALDVASSRRSVNRADKASKSRKNKK